LISQQSTIQKRTEKQYRSQEEQEIIDRVRLNIVRGNSMLRDPLRKGDVTMDDVIEAIKNNRCLSARERDIGSTNLETIVSTSVNELFEVGEINRIRKLFGLEPMKKAHK
jgi:hypothetical protein